MVRLGVVSDSHGRDVWLEAFAELCARARYDAVFHLVTAAKGAEEAYTFANNAARYENVEQAAALDDRIIAAWTGHPHLRVIDNTTDFEEKLIRRVVDDLGCAGDAVLCQINVCHIREPLSLKFNKVIISHGV